MPVKLTLDNTIGAAFLGVCASCILTGISLVQAHLYYNFYTKDWIFQKVAVGVLITLVVLHLIFVLHAVHYYLISNFGNMAALQNTVIWSFKLQILMNAFMILFVQALYASRIWKLGRHFSHVWPIIVGLIVAGGWGIGFAMIVRTFEGKSFGDLHLMSDIIYATYCAATTIDVAIACTMCYYLYRSRSSFARTNSKIVTVMRYILITGCLTSACSLSALITYATLQNTMVFIGIDFLLGNLYVTSYIAMLNARKSMNEREESSVVDVSKVLRSGMFKLGNRTETIDIHAVDNKRTKDDIPLSETTFASNFPNKHDSGRDISSKHLGIKVHQTEERTYDRSD